MDILAFLSFSFARRAANCFKSSSSPRRAARASHSCERRPTRTAVHIEQRGDASIPGGAAPRRIDLHRDET